MSNTDPIKNRGELMCSRRESKFLLPIRHPSCYSYIQLSPVKVLAVVEERRLLCKKYNYIHTIDIDMHTLTYRYRYIDIQTIDSDIKTLTYRYRYIDIQTIDSDIQTMLYRQWYAYIDTQTLTYRHRPSHAVIDIQTQTITCNNWHTDTDHHMQ